MILSGLEIARQIGRAIPATSTLPRGILLHCRHQRAAYSIFVKTLDISFYGFITEISNNRIISCRPVIHQQNR